MKGIGIVVVSLTALLICASCDHSHSKSPTARSVEHLRAGTSEIALSSLIWIAKERGYFAEQGLDIDFKLYESGHLAVQDLLAGHLDLATATEFAAVHSFMDRPDLRIISVLDRAESQQLVARKDRGITQTADLRGKRIGLTKGSSAEYYLHLLLILHDVRLQEVHTIDLLPSEQVKSLGRGDVDAVMVWEPFTAMAKKELGANAESWSSQSGLKDYWLLLSTSEVVRKRGRAIQRFLAALVSAEDFVADNAAKARRIMQEKLGDKFEDFSWDDHKFSLVLDRTLLLKMEAEIIWLKSILGSQEFKMPDLMELIYLDGLKAVRPEKVKMLH
ncbi:MAG: NrtA/SsuA/CpmA family ABC transporter substrate-binding protein [Deltaproteobacteria bacterium]